MFGSDKPSSNFANVVVLLAGFAVISEVTTCQVRRAITPELIQNRSVSEEILKVERGQGDFSIGSVRRHGETQDMLREVLRRLPDTRPATEPAP